MNYFIINEKHLYEDNVKISLNQELLFPYRSLKTLKQELKQYLFIDAERKMSCLKQDHL